MSTSSPTESLRPSGLLPRALAEAQRRLSGPDRRPLRRALAGLAAMAGLAGVGVQPPPLGLLQPVLGDAAMRAELGQSLAAWAPLMVMAGIALLAGAAVARGCALAFIARLLGTEASEKGLRPFLRPGAAHFVGSSALTLPLYALLFGAEWQVAGHAWEALLAAPAERVLPLLLTAVGQFLLVLVPWVLLTLAPMVTLYELVPVAMVREGCGPVAGFRCALSRLSADPRRAARYFGARLVLQVVGSGMMVLLLLPCAVVAAVPASPALALGGWLWSAHAASVPLALALAVYVTALYAVLCAALMPLTAVLFLLADSVVSSGSFDPEESLAGRYDGEKGAIEG